MKLAILVTLAALLGCHASAGAPAPAGVDAAEPLIDPRLSVGTAPLGDLTLWLALGRWTVGDVDALLAEARARHPDPNERLAFLAGRFRGSPFEYESQRELPPPGALRVQLESFDCTTFVIAMLAMTGSSRFEELALALRRIRFAPGGAPDSDPERGNILDFGYDIFARSAVQHGYARDVTAEVAGDTPLTKFRSRVTSRRRTREYDYAERLITPRFGEGEVVSAAMLTREGFAAARGRVKSGDILLFSRVDPDEPLGSDLLIGHMAVALARGGEVYMIHATRDYLWRPDATWYSPALAAGIRYLDDPRREQMGVFEATTWVEDASGRKAMIGDHPYYGYDPSELRPVADYLEGAHVRGVMILRPTERPLQAQAADRAWIASLSPQPGDEPPLPSSALAYDQAVLAGLPEGCPEAVARSQALVDVVHRGFDGRLHQGQIVVHRRIAAEVRSFFAAARELGFPIQSVIPLAHPAFSSGGAWDGEASQRANNTAGFHWRFQTGSDTLLSANACGLAFDVNPTLNPYIKGSGPDRILRPPGAAYDPAAPGTLTADHPLVRRMRAMGWTWGGDYESLKDYQHFEKGACRRDLN